MAAARMQPAQRQAYALSFAMSSRPTPQLATLFFEQLKKMIGEWDKGCKNNSGGQRPAI